VVEILGKLTVSVTSWNKKMIYPLEKYKAKLKLQLTKKTVDEYNEDGMDIEGQDSLKNVIVTLDRNWDIGRGLVNALDIFFGNMLQHAKKFGPSQPMKRLSTDATKPTI